MSCDGVFGVPRLISPFDLKTGLRERVCGVGGRGSAVLWRWQRWGANPQVSQMVESRSMVNGASPGPAPAAQALASNSRLTRSS